MLASELKSGVVVFLVFVSVEIQKGQKPPSQNSPPFEAGQGSPIPRPRGEEISGSQAITGQKKFLFKQALSQVWVYGPLRAKPRKRKLIKQFA